MYGVFTFRSVKSLCPSIVASESGVMFVQWPPFAWTTVPPGPPVRGWPERRAHPPMTAMSATASPDPSRAHLRGDADPAVRRPVVPGRPAAPALRDVFIVGWLLLRLLDIAMELLRRGWARLGASGSRCRGDGSLGGRLDRIRARPQDEDLVRLLRACGVAGEIRVVDLRDAARERRADAAVLRRGQLDRPSQRFDVDRRPLHDVEDVDPGEGVRVSVHLHALGAHLVPRHLLALLAEDRDDVHGRAARERDRDQLCRARPGVTPTVVEDEDVPAA